MHAKPGTVRCDCRHGSSVSSARRRGRAEPGHVVLVSRHHPPRTCMTLEWYRLRSAVHQPGTACSRPHMPAFPGSPERKGILWSSEWDPTETVVDRAVHSHEPGRELDQGPSEFGHHWTRFCRWMGLRGTFRAQACTQYNSVDF
jgi:hypothetical protein